MKVFSKLFVIIFLLPGLVKASSLYLPFDQMRFPDLGHSWQMQTGSGAALMQFDLREEAVKPGQFRSQVILSKRALKSYEVKNNLWRNLEKKALPTNAQIVLNPFDDAKNSGEWRYRTSINLMPVLGNRISIRQGNQLYSLECRSEEQVNPNLYEWCAQVFSKIKWGDTLPVAADGKKQTLNAYAKGIDYNAETVETRLQNLAERFSPSYKDYKEHAYLVILQSLIDNKTNGAWLESQTENLLPILAQEKKPTEPLTDWLQDNRDFLQGRFSQKNAERILQRPDKPPLWLIGAWLRHDSPTLALNLMERDTLDFPFKHSLMGNLYASLGQWQKASEHYSKANPGDNPQVAVQLAQIYFEQKNFKKAKKWLDVALKANPDEASAQFLQAKLLEENDKGEEALQLYTSLASRPSLPTAIAIPVYLKCAENSMDTDSKIKYYNKVLSLQARSPEALYALGRVYMLEKNDSQRSLTYFEKFVQVAPDSDPKVSELRSMMDQMRALNSNAENTAPQ